MASERDPLPLAEPLSEPMPERYDYDLGPIRLELYRQEGGRTKVAYSLLITSQGWGWKTVLRRATPEA